VPDGVSFGAASLVVAASLPLPPPLPPAPGPLLRRFDSDYFPDSDNECECELTDDRQILHAMKHMNGADLDRLFSTTPTSAPTTSEKGDDDDDQQYFHAFKNLDIASHRPLWARLWDFATPTSENPGSPAGCKRQFLPSN